MENALERGPSQCQGRRTDRSWCALQEALGAGAESTTYIDGSEALKTEGVPSPSPHHTPSMPTLCHAHVWQVPNVPGVGLI